jgi:hypothetical protein
MKLSSVQQQPTTLQTTEKSALALHIKNQVTNPTTGIKLATNRRKQLILLGLPLALYLAACSQHRLQLPTAQNTNLDWALAHLYAKITHCLGSQQCCP